MKINNKYFVHESSYVDIGVSIGDNTKIWHFSHIQSGTVIGENCSIGQNVNVGNNVIIGHGVKIQTMKALNLKIMCFAVHQWYSQILKSPGPSFHKKEVNIIQKLWLRNQQV